MNEVKFVHSRRWLEFRNFLSNSGEELQGVQKESEDPTKEHVLERVLKMIPCVDCLTYTANPCAALQCILNQHHVFTKKNAVVSLLDPLGLALFFLIQKNWASGIGWDKTRCSFNYCQTTFDNGTTISTLCTLRIPWSSTAFSSNDNWVEFHVVIDANKIAYGFVVYFLAIEISVRVVLVRFKSRVASHFMASAKGCGSRCLIPSICFEKSWTPSVSKRFQWTESTIVLVWIRLGSSGVPEAQLG